MLKKQEQISTYWKNKGDLVDKVDDVYNLTTHRCGSQKHQAEISSIDSMGLMNKEAIFLDLCCGNGRLTQHYASKVQRAIGVDLSEGFIKRLNKWKEDNTVSNCEFFTLDLLERNFYEKFPTQFSVVLFFGAAQCILDDDILKDVFNNTYKAMLSGGKLLLKQTTSILEEDVEVNTILDGEKDVYMTKYRTSPKTIAIAESVGLNLHFVQNVYSYTNLGKVYKEVECWTNTLQKYFLFEK